MPGSVPNVAAMVQRVVRNPALWRDIAQLLLVRWRELVDEQNIPARWKRAYKRCLRVVSVAPGHATVRFDTAYVKGADRLYAVAVENGIPAGGIDMKPWFLAKHPQGVNIPIVQKGSTIKSFTPTGSKDSISAIRRDLKALEPGDRFGAGRVHKILGGQHLTGRQHADWMDSHRHGGWSRPPAYAHATDPLAQAIRQSEAFHSATTGRKYGRAGSIVVFRRLGPGSDPRSWFWMRNGYKGLHLVRQMRKEAATIVSVALAARR